MALKQYTLYFKGTNKYGHEHNFPLISLELNKLDEYTSNYDGYVSLFNALPKKIKEYIKNNLGLMIDFKSEKVLKELFYITDDDFNPIMDVLFEDDIDVLYVNQEELLEKIIKEKMSMQEFYMAKLKSSLNKSGNKYLFFKYLYETYVKNQRIACMIDVYDVNREFPNIPYDDAMIAAIATDKDNLMILCKKLGQRLESRRNLAFEFKKLFKTKSKINTRIINYSSVNERKNVDLNTKELYDKMIKNLDNFNKKYQEEYKDN